MAKNVSVRKLYAMRRMSIALQRAALTWPFGVATDQALRWATAWGALAGIRSPQMRLRLRRSTLMGAVA